MSPEIASNSPDKSNSILDEFEYVVQVEKCHRLCFGSMESNRFTSQQRMQTREVFPDVAPGCYTIEKNSSAFHDNINKKRSKLGMAPICYTAPRFKHWLSFSIPSPGRYNTCKFSTKFKQNAAPFSSTSKIRNNKYNNNPGPGTYNATKRIKCRRSKFMDNFGVPAAVNSVEIICVKKPQDSCEKCRKICEADYWHVDYNEYLCQHCRNDEFVLHELYEDEKLKQFTKIRNCSFMHDHQNTDAAIRLLPSK
ncbi:unnamed protein product, partial [Phyllotreta striolata]